MNGNSRSPMPPVTGLVDWFNALPDEVKYAFVACWKRREAGRVSMAKLADSLPARHPRKGSEQFFKGLLSFNPDTGRLNRVKRNRRGILQEDIECLCLAINARRRKMGDEGALSWEDFYQAAWEELCVQYAYVRTPVADLAAREIGERLAASLGASPQWASIPSVFHRAPAMDVQHLYVELRLLAQDNKAFNSAVRYPNPDNDFRFQVSPGLYIHPESLLARATERVVIVGAPGSGKSTLVKWACTYLLAHRNRFGVPIPVRLRLFGEALAADGHLSLWQFAVNQICCTAIAPAQRDCLRDDGLVYLLDGWDEVPVHLRGRVRDVVERETRNVRTIITSRQSGVPELLRDAHTEFYELGPLADYAVVELCRNYGALRGHLPLVNDLLDLLERSPSLWAVAVNPYLLTLLCEVVFRRGTLPEAVACSPHWVILQARNLMFADHNRLFPDNPLTDQHERALECLACHLSFDAEKRTVFDTALLRQWLPPGDDGRALYRSRFFNSSVGDQLYPLYEFAHLKMQEFFAAAGALSAGRQRDAAWVERLFQSAVWLEEAGHLAAAIRPPERTGFWQHIRLQLVLPDLAGELVRRVAGILSTAGIAGGGRQQLGCDIRERLWQAVLKDPLFLRENVSALLQLDAEYLARSAGNYIDTRAGSAFARNRVVEQIYRLMPLDMRRLYLDPHFRHHATYSWMTGLPARAFPTIDHLQQVTALALDTTAPLTARLYALRELGVARAMQSAGQLIPLMRDADEQIANAAVEALGKIGGRTVALAMATLLVTERGVFRSVKGTLLNALAIGGYGVLETHSRDLLIDAVSTLPPGVVLEDALDALSGAPIPEPPPRLLRLIRGGEGQPVRMAIAAAGVLSGVVDPDYLTRALLMIDQVESGVRLPLLRACHYIPVDFPDLHPFWERYQSLRTDHREQLYCLLLFIRTLNRFPNHPLGKWLQPELRRILDHAAPGAGQPQLKMVLANAGLLGTSPDVLARLLAIARDTRMDESVRADAIMALGASPLPTDVVARLYRMFVERLGDALLNISLLEALGISLFNQEPALAPELLALSSRGHDSALQRLRGCILRWAFKRGYLIFPGHIVAPDGQKHDAKFRWLH